MTIIEILEQAKPGDRFRLFSHEELELTPSGEVVYCDSGEELEASQIRILAVDWEFTYRAKRCPHCSAVIEDHDVPNRPER